MAAGDNFKVNLGATPSKPLLSTNPTFVPKTNEQKTILGAKVHTLAPDISPSEIWGLHKSPSAAAQSTQPKATEFLGLAEEIAPEFGPSKFKAFKEPDKAYAALDTMRIGIDTQLFAKRFDPVDMQTAEYNVS